MSLCNLCYKLRYDDIWYKWCKLVIHFLIIFLSILTTVRCLPIRTLNLQVSLILIIVVRCAQILKVATILYGSVLHQFKNTVFPLSYFNATILGINRQILLLSYWTKDINDSQEKCMSKSARKLFLKDATKHKGVKYDHNGCVISFIMQMK